MEVRARRIAGVPALHDRSSGRHLLTFPDEQLVPVAIGVGETVLAPHDHSASARTPPGDLPHATRGNGPHRCAPLQAEIQGRVIVMSVVELVAGCPVHRGGERVSCGQSEPLSLRSAGRLPPGLPLPLCLAPVSLPFPNLHVITSRSGREARPASSPAPLARLGPSLGGESPRRGGGGRPRRRPLDHTCHA